MKIKDESSKLTILDISLIYVALKSRKLRKKYMGWQENLLFGENV